MNPEEITEICDKCRKSRIIRELLDGKLKFEWNECGKFPFRQIKVLRGTTYTYFQKEIKMERADFGNFIGFHFIYKGEWIGALHIRKE